MASTLKQESKSMQETDAPAKAERPVRAGLETAAIRFGFVLDLILVRVLGLRSFGEN